MTRPTVQSMAALALVTALMAHLKKGGELSSADANSILERASSLLNEQGETRGGGSYQSPWQIL